MIFQIKLLKKCEEVKIGIFQTRLLEMGKEIKKRIIIMKIEI